MKQNLWWLSILFLFCGLISFTGQATQAAPSNQLFGQEVPTGIRRIGVPESGLVHIDGIDDKPNVTVAVIDSGVDPTHPDLRLRSGIDCYTHPESPAESTQGSSPDDNHGTMAAGIIGAIDNNIGVVGVACICQSNS